MTTDPETQLAHFRRACELLGAGHVAEALDVDPRQVRRLYAGTRNLHAGHLAAIGRALIARAEELRALERQLSPAFTANLTERQATRPLHHRAARPRRQED